MYQIWIQNHINEAGTSLVTTPELVYSIPISESDSEKAFNNPVVKTEMGKTGSMEFSMWPDHPFYKRFRQMKTLIRVVYDGTTIFRGRTLTIDDSPFTGERKIHLEGDMAFLMDSQETGIKEEKREKDNDKTYTNIKKYLQHLIKVHNDQMTAIEDIELGKETYKCFELGETPGNYTSSTSSAQRVHVDNDTYGSDSWRKVYDAFNDLTNKYGGYIRTRYNDANDKVYIDWMQLSFQKDPNTNQTITIASNLIDISSTTEVDNIFTVLVPIGDNSGEQLYIEDYKYNPNDSSLKWPSKSITVPEIVQFFTDEELNEGFHNKSDYENAIKRYGTIYKAQSFSNAKTQDKLWEYMLDYIKNNYVGEIKKFTITALDLHHIEPSKQKFMTGDRVTVQYNEMGSRTGVIERARTVLAVQYNLHDPEKNSYTIGIPVDILSKEYGKKSSKKKSTDKPYTPDHDGDPPRDDDVYTTIDEYKQLAHDYVVKPRYNNDIYAKLMEEDPKKAERAVTSTLIAITEGFLASDGRPTSGTHKKRVQKIVMDGVQGSLTVQGPVDHSHDLTDEQVEELNQKNKFAVLDATTKKFGLKAALDLVTPSTPIKPTPTLLNLQIKSGKKATIEMYPPSKEEDGDDTKQSINLDGENGNVNGQGLNLGEDGTGEDPNVTASGDDGSIQCGKKEDVLKPDGTPYIDKHGNKLQRYKVNLANPIVYVDSNGNVQHTPAGMVGANDFYLNDVPSFKTRFAYIDTAVIPELYSARAEIEELYAKYINADSIDVNTRLRSYKVYTYDCDSTNFYGVNYYIKGEDSPTGGGNLLSCFNQASIDPPGADGKFKITLERIGPGDDTVLDFDMASTQWYKDTLDAEREAVNVGSAIYSPKNDDEYDTYLAPGQWAKAQGWFLNQNNTTTVTTGDGLEGHKGARLIKAAEVSVGTAIHQYVTGDVANETLNPDQWAIAQGQYTNSAGSTSTINPARLIHARALKLKTGAEFTSNMNGDKSVPIPDGYDGFGAITIKKDPHTFGSKTITENGTYLSASDDPAYSGWSTVTVDVPSTTPTLTTLDITSAESSSYFPATPAVGFSKVTVNIPFVQVTDLGIYEDVSGSAGRTPITEDFTLTAAKTLRARYKYGGNWVNGDSITITPSGGSTYYSRNFVCTDITATSNPSSPNSWYYFRIEGQYGFERNKTYSFYRTSWSI